MVPLMVPPSGSRLSSPCQVRASAIIKMMMKAIGNDRNAERNKPNKLDKDLIVDEHVQHMLSEYDSSPAGFITPGFSGYLWC
jgi:hypothetical protein